MFQVLFTNTIVNAAGRILSYISQLIIIAFLIGQLGEKAFGVIVLAEGLILNKDLFESAFGVSTTKYIAEYSTVDVGKIRSVANANYLLTFLLASFFCLVLTVFNHFWLTSFFNIEEESMVQAIALVDLFIAGVFFDSFRVSLTRVCEGFQDYVTARIISFSKSLLWLVFVIIFVLSIGKELTVVGWAYLLSSVSSFVVGAVLVTIKYPLARLKPGSLDAVIFKEMFKFSGWLYLSKFSTLLSRRAHVFIIGYFLDISILTYYHVAYKIYEILNYGNSLISSALIPFSSKLKTLNDEATLVETFSFLTKISFYLIGATGFFLMFRIEKVITFWIEEGFGRSYLVAQIMIASVILMSLVVVGTEMMVGMNRFKRLVKFSIIGSLINLVAALLLINSLELIGVALACLISAATLVILYLSVVLKELGLRWELFFRSICGRAAIVLVLYTVCLSVVKNLWFSLAILILTLAAFWLVMENSERRKVANLIKSFGFGAG
jgi:O-antigen/teichoic acid export membrane protein